MTSEQALETPSRFRPARWLGLVLVLVGFVPSCSAPRQPDIVISPYDTTEGEVLWAIAPVRNETGDLLADTDLATDALALAAEQVVGISVIPNTRTRVALGNLGLRQIETPGDADALAQALGADAVIVGSLTAYEPYSPPKVGYALALHSVTGRGGPRQAGFDLGTLRASPLGRDALAGARARKPRATVSALFDARNAAVEGELKRYARGRTDDASAWGWEQYMASMGLFTEFAAHASVRRLLDDERLRLTRSNAGQQQNRP